MDQKTPSSLDPKLKEVYDRVMNTKVTPQAPGAAAPAAPAQPGTPATTQPTATPTPTVSVSTATPPANKTAVDYAALSQPVGTTPPAGDNPAVKVVVSPSTTTYGVVNSDDKKKPATTDHTGSSTMKMLLIAVGLFVFFLIYTIVWFVVFGVELPFALPI